MYNKINIFNFKKKLFYVNICIFHETAATEM